MAAVANTPDLLEVAASLAAHAEVGEPGYLDAATALADAILETTSPALFGDAVQLFCSSPELLEAAGARFATAVIAQATAPGPDAAPTDVLRAADALEAATRLRLGEWAPRWDLFALLSAYDGFAVGEGPYARAALRAVVACVEAWPEARELVVIARRIAGLEAPAGGPEPDGRERTGEQQSLDLVSPSDASLALGRLAILEALRATDRSVTVGRLEEAVLTLGTALQHDDRPDARVNAAIAQTLRDLVVDQRVDERTLTVLADNVRELRHLHFSRGHWAGEAAASTWSAWARLAPQVAQVQQHFSEPSWLHAVAVIDDLVELYRGTGLSAAYRRSEDGHAVADLLAPVIEEGFAGEVGLMRHLDARVSELQTAREVGTATEGELDDLAVATDIRDAAVHRLAVGDSVRSPKDLAGNSAPADPTDTTHGRDTESTNESTGAGTYLAGRGTAEDRIVAVAERRRRDARFASTSLVVSETLAAVWRGLEASATYREVDEVAEAVDLVTALLVRFLWHSNAIGQAEAPYLFDPDASEDDLAAALLVFVRGSGFLHGVDTEVRHVGGGRVDVRFAFPGFNLFVELKQDATVAPVPDKRSYLHQTATYQVSDPPVGFLLVLKRTPGKTPPPRLTDCVDVVDVTDSGGALRHVVAMTLPGARTKPSDM